MILLKRKLGPPTFGDRMLSCIHLVIIFGHNLVLSSGGSLIVVFEDEEVD